MRQEEKGEREKESWRLCVPPARKGWHERLSASSLPSTKERLPSPARSTEKSSPSFLPPPIRIHSGRSSLSLLLALCASSISSISPPLTLEHSHSLRFPPPSTIIMADTAAPAAATRRLAVLYAYNGSQFQGLERYVFLTVHLSVGILESCCSSL